MSTVVRPATESDLPVLRPLGAILLRTDHEFDRARFLAPGADREQSYAEFLASQLDVENAAVLVAERDNECSAISTPRSSLPPGASCAPRPVSSMTWQ